MNRNSLSTKISIIFIFSILLLGTLFIVLFQYQSEKNLKAMKERQLQSINYVFMLYKNNLSPQGISEYLTNFDLREVTNQNLKLSVLEKGIVIFQKDSNVGRFSSIRYNDRYYLYVDNMVSTILLESQFTKRANEPLWIGFVIALIILIWMYVSMLRSIAPLKKLSMQIRKFASGDMNIHCKSDKEDEIAEVANEFGKAAEKLKDMIDSRQLFLRTIMHELKTPIGKGRIVSEMISDERAKTRLIGIFERLDLLINEFSKMEQIVSKTYYMQVKEYNVVNIIDNAIDMLMLEEDKKERHVKVEMVSDIVVKADFELFSLAIKNLLDNAIKYSDEKIVYVKTQGNKIYIENRGEKFPVAIEEYYKPFISGTKVVKKGLGLGLYIVQNIVKLNNFKLSYMYANEMHKFIIDTKEKKIK
jgi:two-component system OmpR family sensor kinase